MSVGSRVHGARFRRPRRFYPAAQSTEHTYTRCADRHCHRRVTGGGPLTSREWARDEDDDVVAPLRGDPERRPCVSECRRGWVVASVAACGFSSAVVVVAVARRQASVGEGVCTKE